MNISGLAEYAFPFKTFEDAVRLREELWSAITDERKQVRIVVGGGGSTGVELSGELIMWAKEACAGAPSCHVEVLLIEASPTILPGFHASVICLAKKRLERLGVKILTGAAIAGTEKNTITLNSGATIPFDIFAWTGGVKASSLLSDVPMEKEPRGRIKVQEGLQCLMADTDLTGIPHLYALGDSVCFYDPKTKKPIPGVARAALSQADIVAYNLLEDIKKAEGLITRTAHRVFRPWNYPYVIPVGGKYAIARLGSVTISGFPGWILKGLTELNYLLSIMPPLRALTIWLKGLWIFARNDRLG